MIQSPPLPSNLNLELAIDTRIKSLAKDTLASYARIGKVVGIACVIPLVLFNLLMALIFALSLLDENAGFIDREFFGALWVMTHGFLGLFISLFIPLPLIWVGITYLWRQHFYMLNPSESLPILDLQCDISRRFSGIMKSVTPIIICAAVSLIVFAIYKNDPATYVFIGRLITASLIIVVFLVFYHTRFRSARFSSLGYERAMKLLTGYIPTLEGAFGVAMSMILFWLIIPAGYAYYVKPLSMRAFYANLSNLEQLAHDTLGGQHLKAVAKLREFDLNYNPETFFNLRRQTLPKDGMSIRTLLLRGQSSSRAEVIGEARAGALVEIKQQWRDWLQVTVPKDGDYTLVDSSINREWVTRAVREYGIWVEQAAIMRLQSGEGSEVPSLLLVARKLAFELSLLFILMGIVVPLVLRLTAVRLSGVLTTSVVGTLAGEGVSLFLHKALPDAPWKYLAIILLLIISSMIITLVMTKDREISVA